MKASYLIKNIQELVKEHGDLEVGLYSGEYDEYWEIKTIFIPDKNSRGNIPRDDDKSLGDKFIGLSS